MESAKEDLPEWNAPAARALAIQSGFLPDPDGLAG
jgi:hypothetical protein